MTSLVAHGGAGAPAWQLEPLVLAVVLVAAWLFCRAFVHLRRRGRADLAPWWRAAAFAAGTAVAVLAVSSPLDGVAETQLASAHMLQHVLLGDLVPALLVLALGGPMLWLAVPRPVLRAVHRSDLLRAGLHLLARPVVSFSVWAATLAAWHVPAAYEAALADPLVHDVEHGMFFVGGLLVWIQLLDPARRRVLSPIGRIAFAVCVLAVGGALVNVLVFGSPLYDRYAGAGERVIDLSPALDQQTAGMVMLLEQWLTVGAFVLVMLVRRTGSVIGELPARAGEHPLSA